MSDYSENTFSIKDQIMKKILLLLCFTFAMFAGADAQNCNAPAIRHFYKEDIGTAAVKYMWDAGIDTDKVFVPQALYKRIEEGMSAIFNSTSPQRDSVFDLNCIHDSIYIVMMRSAMLFFDDTYAWTAAWKNGQTYTGNAQVDSLFSRYHITVKSYHHFQYAAVRFQNCVVIESAEILNNDPLDGGLEAIYGVNQIDRYGTFITSPGAGYINYREYNNIREYEFILAWADCISGCGNYHGWVFNVDQNCNANFSYSWDNIAYPMVQRPDLRNCNISDIPLSIQNPVPSAFKVYPSPASDILYVEGMEGSKIVLINQLGVVIRQMNITKTKEAIPVSDLASGIYWLGTNKGMSTKVIIAH